eukprot:6205232-Pleurochrysis_carterae.AAC.3
MGRIEEGGAAGVIEENASVGRLRRSLRVCVERTLRLVNASKRHAVGCRRQSRRGCARCTSIRSRLSEITRSSLSVARPVSQTRLREAILWSLSARQMDTTETCRPSSKLRSHAAHPQV